MEHGKRHACTCGPAVFVSAVPVSCRQKRTDTAQTREADSPTGIKSSEEGRGATARRAVTAKRTETEYSCTQ